MLISLNLCEVKNSKALQCNYVFVKDFCRKVLKTVFLFVTKLKSVFKWTLTSATI